MSREVLWSELVADLLGDIIDRLCLTDRVRFRAVCKSWRDAKPIINTASTSASVLPLLFCFGSRNQEPTRELECRLYDPSYSIDEPVSVHTISFKKLRIPVIDGRHITTFCKQGWLFISITKITGLSKSRIDFILFSPLTKKLKQLPSLITASSVFKQTFSSDPECADCVFLLLHTSIYDDVITVTTCRKGDREWTIRNFEQDISFMFSGAIYTRGSFYIISRHGQLASYNVVEEKLEYESLYADTTFAISDTQHKHNRVFMRNGELMFNYLCKNGTKRFDWSKKVWIPVSSCLTDPPALVVGHKIFTRVEDMVEILDSKCPMCSSESADIPEYVFNSGTQDYGTNPIFWLEPRTSSPSLKQKPWMHTTQITCVPKLLLYSATLFFSALIFYFVLF